MSFFGYVPPNNPSFNPQNYFGSQPPNLANVEVSKPRGFFSGLGKLASGLVPSFLGSGLQFLFDSIAAKKQRKIAQQQYDQMNAYNSPVAQMARYKAAGMHPAYGAANFNNNSVAFSNASTNVARPVVPDVSGTMREYQTAKNAGIEENIIRERLVQEKLKSDFLGQTLDPRIVGEHGKAYNSLASYDSTVQRTANMKVFGYLDALLKDQSYQNLKILNPIIQQLQGILLQNADAGLNPSDSTFLRNRLRIQQGSKSANDMFKYVLGDRLASFGGDLLKIGIPSGAIAKMWGSTKPK